MPIPGTDDVVSHENLHDRTRTLARNLWWTWHPEVVNLFFELDPHRWREVGHNPHALLEEFPPERLERRAGELVLDSRINYAYRRFQEYLRADATWGQTHAGPLRVRPVAYFSAEFCLHESLPIYSGGLGVLAGDHLKSASDLGVPMVGVGLLYRQGYFGQRLDGDGWQHEEYVDTDVSKLPMDAVLDATGAPLIVSIETRVSTVLARVWRMDVGRNMLLLLDSNVEGNSPEARNLTARLYGGDDRMRIRQELILGVGGLRALRAVGIRPSVLHLNEGHSAFAALEATRQSMEVEGLGFADALARMTRRIVFTTHTPVPAGHDRFSPELIEEHLGPLRDALGLAPGALMALGRVAPESATETFCMTVLALKLSRRANAVSAIHGRVSRRMWNTLWPSRSEDEVPIGHITNGVHVLSWLSPQMLQLYDRHFGHTWTHATAEPATWAHVESIANGELWETHLAMKARLVEFVRRRLVRQYQKRGEAAEIVDAASKVLDQDALLIGFARRFAVYKRAALIFSDLPRIMKLMNDADRPIQFVFAGEAHPKDDLGKGILQQIARLTRHPDLAGKIVFVEDYDMHVTRHLVQGVDVWLNNPRRPLEASGTSGQKAVLNGALNLSVLDGWWAEAFDGENGFGIGAGDVHGDPEVQDLRDAESLYATLEREVLPLYYQRDVDGLPNAWIQRMKRAIRTLGWRFNADRMVMDYVRECYLGAAGGLSCDMPQR